MRRAHVGIGRQLWVVAALGVFAVARLAPPLEGLTPLAQCILGTVVAGAILWVSEAVPIGVSSLLVLVLLGLCPGLRLPDAAIGFAGEVTFFLVGVAGIGAAVEQSGLAARAARVLARGARGSTGRLFVQMIAGFPVLAFLVPSAITRNAVL